MKAHHWLLPSLLMTVLAGVLWIGTARAESPRGVVRYEYKHLLIPLDRRLDAYQREDVRLLEPLQRLGREGWELVTANEPANGFKVDRKATVEFWLKRPLP